MPTKNNICADKAVPSQNGKYVLCLIFLMIKDENKNYRKTNLISQ